MYLPDLPKAGLENIPELVGHEFWSTFVTLENFKAHNAQFKENCAVRLWTVN